MPEESKLPNGPAIKAARRTKKLTQQQLAELAGYNVRTIQEAEYGERKTLTVMDEIATALGVPLESIILDEADESTELFANQRVGGLETLIAEDLKSVTLTTDRDLPEEDQLQLNAAIAILLKVPSVRRINIEKGGAGK